MGTTASSSYHQPHVAVRRKKATFMGSWTIAPTTGVAALVDVDDPQMTLTRTAAGTYALVYPAAATGTQVGTAGKAHVNPTVMNSGASAAGMTTSARLTAVAPQSGTATVQIVGGNSGVAIDPVAADVVTLFIKITVDCNA